MQTFSVPDLEDDVQESLLQADVAVLNAHGVRDTVLAHLAAEHAARIERLMLMVEPTLGRAVLLTAAAALLEVAKTIDAMTYQEPELVDPI